VVIGGEHYRGAGIALDGASRGLTVALIEKCDFASGTSSRSTKLIHGGLRYLAQFRFRLTREALAERLVAQELAPNLVEPIPFLFPIYHRRLEVWEVKHRSLALRPIGRHPQDQGPPPLNRQQTLQKVPSLRADDLRASFVYYDARTTNSRLVVEVLKAAVERGAVVANYVSGERITSRRRARPRCSRDRPLSGDAIDIRASESRVATGRVAGRAPQRRCARRPRRIRRPRAFISLSQSAIWIRDSRGLPTHDGRLMVRDSVDWGST